MAALLAIAMAWLMAARLANSRQLPYPAGSKLPPLLPLLPLQIACNRCCGMQPHLLHMLLACTYLLSHPEAELTRESML